MVANENILEKLTDFKDPADTEVALYFLRLLDDLWKARGIQGPAEGDGLIIEMAKNALTTMTNPFAKKLLMDKITEQ